MSRGWCSVLEQPQARTLDPSQEHLTCSITVLPKLTLLCLSSAHGTRLIWGETPSSPYPNPADQKLFFGGNLGKLSDFSNTCCCLLLPAVLPVLQVTLTPTAFLWACRANG